MRVPYCSQAARARETTLGGANDWSAAAVLGLLGVARDGRCLVAPITRQAASTRRVRSWRPRMSVGAACGSAPRRAARAAPPGARSCGGATRVRATGRARRCRGDPLEQSTGAEGPASAPVGFSHSGRPTAIGRRPTSDRGIFVPSLPRTIGLLSCFSSDIERLSATQPIPEGGFANAPGIRPFRLGAFKAAVESGKPVVPVAIVGTRAILGGGRTLPRRGRIEVTIAPPITPRGADWPEMVRLRDATRSQIAEITGEWPVTSHPGVT
jgi:hypothetical protein